MACYTVNVQDGIKDKIHLHSVDKGPICPGTPHPCNDCVMLQRVINCRRFCCCRC